MPRAKASGNSKAPTKASAIREILASNPKAKTKDIVAELAAKGIKVSENHVYIIKSKAKAKRRWQRRTETLEASRRAGGI